MRILRKVIIKLLNLYKNFLGDDDTVFSYVSAKIKNEEFLFSSSILLHNIIRPEFSSNDAFALTQIIKMIIKNNIKIVEIGSWTGSSTSVIGKTILPYKGSVFAVDHWLGSPSVEHHKIAKNIDIFSIFKYNMIKNGIWEIVHPIVADSAIAAEIFSNESVDMVFIDGDHTYNSVKKDILLWFPKVKKGGIICGHDCECFYAFLLEEDKKLIDNNLDRDTITYKNEYGYLHPGVIKALYDIWGSNYKIYPNSTIWYLIKK